MIYLILVIVFLFIIFKSYLAIKHPFWSKQPVFHIYNIYYWILKRGIIYNKLPPVNKYYDPYITFYNLNNISNKNKSEIKKFIRNNWYNNYYCIPYINNLNKIGVLQDNNNIIGTIGGEFLTFNNKQIMYIDYLCVNKNHRNKKISPKLIYNIFVDTFKNDNTKIFLFKWENKSINIIPLCVYNCFTFENLKFNIQKSNSIIEITENKLHLFDRDKINKLFKYSILCNNESLIKQIKDNYTKIYALIESNKILALYFFHIVENNKFICYSSIMFGTKEEFIFGFKNILNSFDKYSIQIENISHNNIIVESLMKDYKPVNIDIYSYYFYNYIKLPELSKNILIIN